MKRLKNKLTKKYLRFCYISHKLTIIVLLKESFFHVITISTLLDKNSFFRLQRMVQKMLKYLQQIHEIFSANKLLLQLEALSNCDNFIVITILQ